MKLGLVNDLPIALEALERIVAGAGHEVAWKAMDGEEAVALCRAVTPDLVLMDLFMPVMDGVEATRLIMRQSPCPVLVVTATVDGASSKVFDAMSCGALDAVNTPAVGAAGDLRGGDELLRKIDMIGRMHGCAAETPRRERHVADGLADIKLAVVGASTGGPGALTRMLDTFPLYLKGAIIIVQHVDAQFAPGLADWLQQHTATPVKLATPGDTPQRNRVYIAASRYNLVLDGEGRFAETTTDSADGPSIDAMMESLREHGPAHGVAALLTGMGEDGARGLLALRQAGWTTLAQDRESCVVWGMPRAAERLGAAEEALPPEQLARRIVAWMNNKE